MAQRATALPVPNKTIKTGYLFIAGSLVLAVITGVILVNVLMGYIRTATKPAPTQQIVVAANEIAAGQIIALQDLKVADWPASHVPEGDVFESPSTLVGRVAKSEVLPGEPLYRAKLAGEYSTGGLKILLPKGLRGVTVAVTEVSGVGGFVKPGDRVDVVAIFKNLGHSNQLQKSKTILQDVMVMAAAQQMTAKDTVRTKPETTATSPAPNPTDKNTAPTSPENTTIKEEPAHVVTSVTLALNPEQVEKLALADETADIRLVLRSENDHAYSKTEGVLTTQLTGMPIATSTVGTPAPASNNTMPPLPRVSPRLGVSGHVIEFIDSGQKSQWTY